MKNRNSALALVAGAGLAVSSAAFGQLQFVNNIPGSFTDITAVGGPPLTGDDTTAAATISAAAANVLFPAGTISLCMNGHVGYGNDGNFSNGPIPSPSFYGGGAAAAVFWDDLITLSAGTGVFHAQVTENGVPVFIVEWFNVEHFASSPSGATFELKVFGGAGGPNGAIAQFLYQDVDFGDTSVNNGLSATIGYQTNGTSGTQFSYNTASVSNGSVLSLTFTGPTGACCLPSGTCSISDAGGCATQGGLFRGVGTSCATANCPSGACCLGDGSCVVSASAGCAAQNGVYRGDGSSCATAACPQGACCIPVTGCILTGPNACVAQGGTYRGDGTGCATANCPGPTIGPDVFVGHLTDVGYFATVGDIAGYAVGTDACNAGDAPASWISSTNQHPVVAQNMYRLMNGRFEQLGQSWLKHTFASTNSSSCGTCHQPPMGSAQLGVGCSDAYGSGLNGDQPLLGPRSQVNATTGAYPYPFTAPPIQNAVSRLLQVSVADVTPAQNQGALYFVDAYYCTADDASWNNSLNNATYQQVLIPSPTSNPALTGSVHSQQPGIMAWRNQDPTVTQVNADYTENGITCRFIVAAKVTDNGNGTWHYEYAVYNHNANRNAGSFTVPMGAGVAVTNTGFHAPLSHSGEPYDNSAWTPSVGSGSVSFATTPYSTNVNANAIRWGTMYNFRFDAAVAPVTGVATIGLFSPGSPATVVASGLPVPGTSATCYANCDASAQTPFLNVNDFICFQARFAAGDTYANCDNSTTTPILNVNDFICFQMRFAAGCSAP